MVTLPVHYAVSDPNRVEPIDRQAAMVWAALRADRPIPAAATKGSAADRVDAKKVVEGTSTAETVRHALRQAPAVTLVTAAVTLPSGPAPPP